MLVTLWLARNLIVSRLTASIKHEYDTKLSEIQSVQRRSEENLKAKIRDKELEIKSLQDGALASVISRQATLYSKQVESVDKLWNGIVSLASAKSVAHSLSVFKFEPALKASSENVEFRGFLAGMKESIDIDAVKSKDTDFARPFVSPLAWAYFDAYRAIIGHFVAKIQLLSSGLNEPQIIDKKHVVKLLKELFPKLSSELENDSGEYFYIYLDPLENLLLSELRNILKGDTNSDVCIEQAAKIRQAVTELTNADSSVVQKSA